MKTSGMRETNQMGEKTRQNSRRLKTMRRNQQYVCRTHTFDTVREVASDVISGTTAEDFRPDVHTKM